MPSAKKTQTLSLNQYQGTDKPSFLDYNTDMSKIDSIAKRSILYPQYVPDGTDFNTLTLIGDYFNEAHSSCQNMTNSPVKCAFYLTVRSIGCGSLIQTWSDNTGNLIYTRAFYNWASPAVWSSWTNSALQPYPVGSIYMSVNSTSPACLFGGAWEAWGKGRVPLGCGINHGNNYPGFGACNAGIFDHPNSDTLGGEYSHILSQNEMPIHTHSIYSGYQGNGGVESPSDVQLYNRWSIVNQGYRNFSADAGASYAHNIIQPYQTCYMWKRVA